MGAAISLRFSGALRSWASWADSGRLDGARKVVLIADRLAVLKNAWNVLSTALKGLALAAVLGCDPRLGAEVRELSKRS
jgi:hypothetical protein